jgi:glycosyltransferase involved in cell wall biosynthesis
MNGCFKNNQTVQPGVSKSISVIVPAFNEEKLLPQSLPAIRNAMKALAGFGFSTELIVCDNNSTDRTAEVAKSFGATIVFEKINQISRARNRGGFEARGDWLIFVDADSFPSFRLFGEVARGIQEERYLGGGAHICFDTGMGPVLAFMAGIWNLASIWTRWCAGAFIFVEASAFRAIGGFSDQLFASEEIDFSKRLRKYARKQGKEMVILRYPELITSSRKLHLYSARMIVRTFFRAAVSPRKTLTNRDECFLWYDGKR